MIGEFVGFEAYEAACEGDIGLLGWSPVDTALWLKISMRDVLRAVHEGVLHSGRPNCRDPHLLGR